MTIRQGRNLYSSAVRAGKQDIRMVIMIIIVFIIMMIIMIDIMTLYTLFTLYPIYFINPYDHLVLSKVCFAADLGCDHSFISKTPQLPALIRFPLLFLTIFSFRECHPFPENFIWIISLIFAFLIWVALMLIWNWLKISQSDLLLPHHSYKWSCWSK